MTRATLPGAFRAIALAALAALTVTACGGGGGLPEDPQEAVVAAVENRAEGGHSGTFSVELSDRAIELAREDDPEAAEVLEAFQGDVATYTVDDPRFGFALQIDGDQPVQVRNLGDAFYLLVDIPALVERFDVEGTVDMEDVRNQVSGASVFLGNLAPIVDAWLEGRWGGVVEIPDNPGEQASEVFSDVLPPELQEQVQPGEQPTELMSELGLDDPRSFVETYVQVEEGGDGRYEASIRARALAEAFVQLAQEAGPAAAMAGQPTQEELSDIPETVGGLIVETEGDQISRVELDPVSIARSLGETETEGLEEGDVVLSLSFADPDGALLEEPDDAETVTFEQLLDTLERFGQLAQQFMGGFSMEGGAQQGGSQQIEPPVPTEDLPEDMELPSEMPSGFPTEMPTQ